MLIEKPKKQVGEETKRETMVMEPAEPGKEETGLGLEAKGSTKENIGLL